MSNDADLSRRTFLVGAGAIGTTLAFSGLASAAEPPSLSKTDIDRMMKELSNWGRWGKEDQLGTLNLITTAKRKHALSLAREAMVVSLSHALSTEKSLDNSQPLIHIMHGVGGDGSSDTYTLTYHGNYDTHLDAFCHQFWDGQGYNGFPSSIVTSEGANKLDIAVFRGGIVTRGVLLDIPRAKGVRYLEPDVPIYPEDLDAAEKMAHVKVTSGDALMLRTGRWARRAEKGSWNTHTDTAGLYATSARWLKERDVAVMTSDSVSDVHPSHVDGVPLPIHKLLLVAIGLPIMDNLDLEELSQTAIRLNRWEFLLTAAPMVIPGGTGSPLNPLAIF